MKPSEQAKAAGLKGLSEVCEISGQSHQTLNNWYNNKPQLFRTVIAGCVLIKFQEQLKNV